jgi:hypothetical protein
MSILTQESPHYTHKQAAERNRLLDQAFDVCEKEGADIYELCIEVFMHEFYKQHSPEL